MPKNQQKIQVVKIPLKGLPTCKPQVFPRLPRLYLELIENKSKIRQDLINKEHIPISTPQEQDQEQNKDHSIERDSPIKKDYNFAKDKDYSSKSKSKFENRLDMLLSDNDSDASDDKTNTSYSDSISSPSSLSELSIDEKITDKKDYYTSTVHKKDYNPPKDFGDNNSESSDNLSLRLKDLLKNDDEESQLNYKSQDKYSRHRDKYGHSVESPKPGFQNPSRIAPPTLAELEAKGGYIPRKELRDISQQQGYNEQQEEDAKRELLFKFDLLRKSYPASSIPEYSIHTDLSTMEKSYSDCVRRLSLDSSVESYKTYLVYGFMGCEFIFGNFLGFDMQGFTQQQIISMNSYEKLLIELGEKSYVPTGSKWPIELRLLFMIIMNAAFFIISKMMMRKTGANLMNMINGMNGGGTPTTNSTQKRKMRGPNIDINDIPNNTAE